MNKVSLPKPRTKSTEKTAKEFSKVFKRPRAIDLSSSTFETNNRISRLDVSERVAFVPKGVSSFLYDNRLATKCNDSDNTTNLVLIASKSVSVGRNDPCWCGSKNSRGKPKKYKQCHLWLTRGKPCPSCEVMESKNGKKYLPGQCECKELSHFDVSSSESTFRRAKAIYRQHAGENVLESVLKCGTGVMKLTYRDLTTGRTLNKFRRGNYCWNEACLYCGPKLRQSYYWWLRLCLTSEPEVFITKTYLSNINHTSLMELVGNGNNKTVRFKKIEKNFRQAMCRLFNENYEVIYTQENHTSGKLHLHEIWLNVPTADALFDILRYAFTSEGKRVRNWRSGCNDSSVKGFIPSIWQSYLDQMENGYNKSIYSICRDFSCWAVAKGFNSEFVQFKKNIATRIVKVRADVDAGKNVRHGVKIIKRLTALVAEMKKVKPKYWDTMSVGQLRFAKAVLLRQIIPLVGKPYGYGHVDVKAIKEKHRNGYCNYILKHAIKVDQFKPVKGISRFWATKGAVTITKSSWLSRWKKNPGGVKLLAKQRKTELSDQPEEFREDDEVTIVQPVLGFNIPEQIQSEEQVAAFLSDAADVESLADDQGDESPRIAWDNLQYISQQSLDEKFCDCESVEVCRENWKAMVNRLVENKECNSRKSAKSIASRQHGPKTLENYYRQSSDEIVKTVCRHLRSYDGTDIGFIIDSFWTISAPVQKKIFDGECFECGSEVVSSSLCEACAF